MPVVLSGGASDTRCVHIDDQILTILNNWGLSGQEIAYIRWLRTQRHPRSLHVHRRNKWPRAVIFQIESVINVSRQIAVPLGRQLMHPHRILFDSLWCIFSLQRSPYFISVKGPRLQTAFMKFISQ